MEVLTVKETAQLLKISTDKVYELAKTPGFPAFPIGRSIRINKEELARWVSSQIGSAAHERISG